MAFLGGLFGRTSSGLSSRAQALLDQYESQSREASAAQEGYLQHAGETAASDIRRQTTEDLGTLQSSLAARGLGNTSVYDALASREREGEGRALSANAENTARARAEYVYRPNASLAGYAMQAANTTRHTAGPLSGFGSLAGAAVGTAIAPGVGTALGAMAGGALEGAATGQGAGQGGYEGLGYGATLAPFAQQAMGGSGSRYGVFGSGVGSLGTLANDGSGMGAPAGMSGGYPARPPAATGNAWERMAAPVPGWGGDRSGDAGEVYDPYKAIRERRRNA